MRPQRGFKRNKDFFKWGQISDRQRAVLLWWRSNSSLKDKELLVCDGAIRSGKTIPMSLSFVMWAMKNFNGEVFGLTGKTIGSLRRNLVLPLKKMLTGRGYQYRERLSEKLLIVSYGGNTNEFEYFGGKDEASQGLIQGRTLAGVLCDEAVLQPKSFINQAIARCSVLGSKVWLNCNPEGPNHWIKTDIIDRIDDLNGVRIHFQLDDNLTLPDTIKNRYRQFFKGVFYRRYILGEWAVADGLIYDIYDEAIHLEKRESYDKCIVAVDYGTSNPTTFGLYVWSSGDVRPNLKREYYYDSRKEGRQKSDSEYADDFSRWLGEDRPDAIYLDPSAASFWVELVGRGYGNMLKKAKNNVVDGIRVVYSMLAGGKYTIDPSCAHTRKEIVGYVWDEKAPDDTPVKKDDHAMDRDRYALYSHFGRRDVTSIPGLGACNDSSSSLWRNLNGL